MLIVTRIEALICRRRLQQWCVGKARLLSRLVLHGRAGGAWNCSVSQIGFELAPGLLALRCFVLYLVLGFAVAAPAAHQGVPFDEGEHFC